MKYKGHLTLLITFITIYKSVVYSIDCAILYDPQLNTDSVLSKVYKEEMENIGLSVAFLNANQIMDSDQFNATNYKAILLLNSPSFPINAQDNLKKFIEDGGDIVFLGGVFLSEPYTFSQNSWVTQKNISNQLAEAKRDTFLDFKTFVDTDYSRDTNDLNRIAEKTITETGIKFSNLMNTKGWDTHIFSVKPHSQPMGIIHFQAKANKYVTEVNIEVTENDGSRWITNFQPNQQFETHIFSNNDFQYFRGGSNRKDTIVNFANINTIRFGYAEGLTQHYNGLNEVWINEISFYGPEWAVDFKKLFKHEFPIFNHIGYSKYQLENVSKISVHDGLFKDIIVDYRKEVSGYTALGIRLKNKSHFFPLLSAKDNYGRIKGWALGLLAYYDSPYKNSNFLVSGIEDIDFYYDKGVQKVIAKAVKEMTTGHFVHLAKTKLEKSINHDIPKVDSPKKFVTLSDDKKSFISPEGKSLFFVGVNYLGPFDRTASVSYLNPNFGMIEKDFIKAAKSGINLFRTWLPVRFFVKQKNREKFFSLCAKYNIYQFIHFRGDGLVNDNPCDIASLKREVESLARALKNQTMVIGYDLQNEPYLGDIGSLTLYGEKLPARNFSSYEKYKDIVGEYKIQNLLNTRPTGFKTIPSWIEGEDAKNIATSILMWELISSDTVNGGKDYSTITGLRKIDLQGEYADIKKVVNDTFDIWATELISSIKKYDPNHMISIGFNYNYFQLPFIEKIDFFSHHVYQRPYTFDELQKNNTTLDRIAAQWPDKITMLGEFGYSTGDFVNGMILGEQASAIGEMMNYLSAYANGHSGVMKWMLDDRPLPTFFDATPWSVGPEANMRYEEGFGFFFHDGTEIGDPKAISHALNFFSEHIETSSDRGEYTPYETENQISAGFVYESNSALFVGDSKFNSEILEFDFPNPAIVMLSWTNHQVKIMSTCDGIVKINFSNFPTDYKFMIKSMSIEGRMGEEINIGKENTVSLHLLSGQVVSISNKHD